jgi:hypothetical protein
MNNTTAAVTPATKLTSEDIRNALALVTEGRIYDLDCECFPGMPLLPGHPPFQVLTHRTPPGLDNQRDQDWPQDNEVNFRWHSEVVMGTVHSARTSTPSHTLPVARTRAGLAAAIQSTTWGTSARCEMTRPRSHR